MPRLLRYMRFGVFALAIVVLSVTLLPLSMVISLLSFKRCPPFSLIHIWRDMFFVLCRTLLGIRYRVEGLHNLPKNQSLLFAVKHQSLWETIALHRILPIDLFVARSALRWLPLWGWALYLSRVAVFFNRKRPMEGTRKLVQYIQWRLQHQSVVCVVFFPEGRRTLPRSSPEYKRGIAFLYDRLDMLLVPVALNSGYVWPKKGYVRAGTITVSVLKPLPRKLPRAEFLARLQREIEQETERIGPA